MRTIVLVFFGLILFGCKTTYVPVEYKTIEYVDRYVLDSVFHRDTVRIEKRNDTVFNEVIRWRERFKVDTISSVRIDSIPFTVEVEKIIEVNKLTWWQNLRLKVSNIILLIGVGLVLFYLIFRK